METNPELSEQIRRLLQINYEPILQRVKENTKTEYIKIRTKLETNRIPITSSKFGSYPYWPNDRSDYPKSSTGIPLTLLAQINLSDLPQNNVFPDNGLLQFYIWNLADWGNYEVIFHETYDKPLTPYLNTLPTSFMPDSVTITKESGEKMTVPNLFWGESGMFPISGRLKLEFSKEYDYVNITENCFYSEVIKAANELGIYIPNEYYISNNLPEKFYNEFYEFSGGHKLLGHPCFVQNDYREEGNKDILLLQIDSAWHDTGETSEQDFISFGDAGTAGFFINPDDLKNLDFSNVYYDWQCG